VAYWIKSIDPSDGQVIGASYDASQSQDGCLAILGGNVNGNPGAAIQLRTNDNFNLGQFGCVDLLNTDIWTLHIASCDLSLASPVQYYLADTEALDVPSNSVEQTASLIGVPQDDFFVGQEGFGSYQGMDLADFRVWIGSTADLSDQSIRRLFIDANGKPVDPATAIAALGAPVINLCGDATTMAANTGGSGGTFTATALTNATTSPSD
jgi:hypothetical protein